MFLSVADSGGGPGPPPFENPKNEKEGPPFWKSKKYKMGPPFENLKNVKGPH